MRHVLTMPGLCAVLLLGGCATFGGPRGAPELAGARVRLVSAQGQASTLYFASNGTVRSTFGRRTATGRWSVRRGRLCFLWAGDFRECWPYRGPLPKRRTVTIRSDRGNVVRVTLL